MTSAATVRRALLVLAVIGVSAVLGAGPASASTAAITPHRVQHLTGSDVYQAQTPRVTARAAAGVTHGLAVNTVIPDFVLKFGYNVVHDQLQLTKLIIDPFFHNLEIATGGCVKCTGPGSFAPAKISGNTYTDSIIGKKFIGRHTVIVEEIAGRGRIGRYKVYGLDADIASPRPVLVAARCTPANLKFDFQQVLDFRHLPTVPCSAPNSKGDHLSIATPVELSSHAHLAARVSGHATGRQYLVVFQSQRGKRCAPDSISEALATQAYFARIVSGNFTVRYHTAHTSSPGFTCAYLQDGGTVKLTNGLTVPYGRVNAFAGRVYLAGDRISVNGPGSAAPGQSITVTLNGFASIKEQIYFFAPGPACDKTAQAEYSIDHSGSTRSVGHGRFHFTVPATIAQNSSSTIHLCAYLQFGTPTSGVPVGVTLARGTASISVGGGSAAPIRAVTRRMSFLRRLS